MTVKEIVLNACLLLSREEEKDYLLNGKNESDEIVKNIDKFVKLTSLVINELAHTYIPLIHSEEVVGTGKIFYRNLQKTPLKIVNVLNERGEKFEFAEHNEFFTAPKGKITVEYECLPSEFNVDSQIEYSEKDVPARVITYGLVSEILLTECNFSEAVMWHKRYVSALEEIVLPKNKSIKKRSWL